MSDVLPADVRQSLLAITETYARMCKRAGLRIVDADEDAPDAVTLHELQEPAARLEQQYLKTRGAMAAVKARMGTISPSDLTPPMPAMYRAFLSSGSGSASAFF